MKKIDFSTKAGASPTAEALFDMLGGSEQATTGRRSKFTPHEEIVPLSKIQPHPENAFAEEDKPEEIEELAADIKANGMLHPPVVNKTDGIYRLISGERRWKAVQLLEWQKVRCTVYEGLSHNEEIIMLYSANLRARDYSASRKLRYYKKLEDLFKSLKEKGEITGSVQLRIAALMGISERQVRKYERISENLTEEARKEVEEGRISVEQAYRTAQEKPIQTEQKKEKGNGAPAEAEDMAFWEPYLKDHFMNHDRARIQRVVKFYKNNLPSPAEAAKFLKQTFNNSGGTAGPFFDGKQGDYDFFSGRIQLTVEDMAKDGHRITKRHVGKFTWPVVERLIRQMIVDGALQLKDSKKAVAAPAAVNSSADDIDSIYNVTTQNVLRLMELLKNAQEDEAYENISKLYGALMHYMGKSGHKAQL